MIFGWFVASALRVNCGQELHLLMLDTGAYRPMVAPVRSPAIELGACLMLFAMYLTLSAQAH
jgi:hypothetical protein